MSTKTKSKPRKTATRKRKPLDMPADVFIAKLTNLNACSDGKSFVAGKSLRESWEAFERPDWMLWLLGRSQVSKKIIATIAVEFAEMVAHHAKDYPAVAKCIAVVKRYLNGEATQEELSAAEYAAGYAAEYAASAAGYAASAARYAASAAGSAAEYAASAAGSAAEYAASAAGSAGYAARSAAWSAAEYAASAAGYAAGSAARSAAWSAAEYAASAAWYAAGSAASAAWSAAKKEQCEIIRKHVSPDEIVKLFV